MAGFDFFGGLGGLGGMGGTDSAMPAVAGSGFDYRALLAGLGQSLLTSPRYAPLSGLPAGIQAAQQATKQRVSDSAMVLALTKAGIDPQTAAILANNPTAAALMISQGNAQKQQAFREKAMATLGGGSLVPPAGAGGLGGLGGTVPGGASADPIDSLQKGIQAAESGGNYQALGPMVTQGQYAGQRALGAHQVMPGNLPEWTKEHVGRELSPQEFLRDKEAQDAVFRGEMTKNLAKYGTIEDAASVWFTGRPYKEAAAAGATDGFMRVQDYVAKVKGNMPSGGAPVRVAQADTGTATDALPTNQFAGPGAKIPAAIPDKTLPGLSPAPAGANATRAWANQEAQRALGVIAGAGDDKGLMEAAKAKFDAVKGYLTQSEAEKNLAAAGIDPTSRAGREALTGGVGIKLEELGLKKQEFAREGEKFDYERFKTDRAYRQQVENENRTTETKNYDAYAAQERAEGREPLSRFNFEREMKQSGATKIDLAEKRQSLFDQERDKVNVKRFSGMVEEGDSAASDLSLIRQLRQMGGAIDQKSLPALRGWLADKGVKVGDDIGVIEAYNSVLDRMTPAQRQGMPGAASDRDVSMFRGSLPSLLKTPGGNAIVTDTMEALALHKQQRAAIADQVIQGQLTPEKATEAIRNLPDPLATFKDFRSEGITAESENAPKQAPLIYTGKQYDALPVGSTYRDAKGQLRQKKAERAQ